MKNKKTKISIGLSVILFGVLLSSSSLNIIYTEALVERTLNPKNTIFFDKSTGKWNLTEIVSTESTLNSNYPSLAIDLDGNVHVVWEDNTNYAGAGTDKDIFYKCWKRASTSWTVTEVVSTETETQGGSTSPVLAVDSAGNVHVAWEGVNLAGTLNEHQIFYKYRNVLTQSWNSTELVSTESSDFSGYPTLAVDALRNVHISWYDLSNYDSAGVDYDIFYKRYEVLSSSWTTTEVVSTESTVTSGMPSLAVDPLGNIHIAWYDMTDYAGAGSDFDIFYKRWEILSSSWTTTEVVSTESASGSYNPSLAIHSFDNIHIAWVDFTDYLGSGTDTDIFYKKWDSVNSWSTTVVVSSESTIASEEPSLAVDSEGDIHIAWNDLTNYAGSGGDEDIFYKWCDSSFSSWDTTEVVSTESTLLSFNPSLAIDAVGNVHVAWDDITEYTEPGGDYDIFYKILANAPVTPELTFIVPNPIETDTVSLNWNDVSLATAYHVYRSTSHIWSIDALTPISTISSSEFIDTLPSIGFYYYVIVAENFAGNSTHSNCQYIEYELPSLNEFVIVSSLIVTTSVLLFVITRIRKKKSKQD